MSVRARNGMGENIGVAGRGGIMDSSSSSETEELALGEGADMDEKEEVSTSAK